MKKIISIAISLIMLQTAVFAADFNQTIIGDGLITYQGSANKNASVTFTVLDPETTLDEFMLIDNGETPICYREVTADDNGKYSVIFDIGGMSDTYNIYIGATGQTEINYVALRYIDESENAAARDLLFADGVDVADVIKNNAKALGVRKAMYQEMDDELYGKAATIYSASGVVSDTLSEVAKACEKSIGIVLWNESKLDIFGDNMDALSIPETVSSWYGKSYMTDAVKVDIALDMSKTSDSFVTFDKAITEKTALAVIEYADGYGDVKTYLTDNADLLGINESKVTDAFCRSIVGKKYDSVFGTGIDTFKEPESGLAGSGGGNGGNGGGSGNGNGNSGGGGNSSYHNVTIQEEQKRPEPIVERVTTFSDMQGYDWALDAVTTLHAEGIIQGKIEGVFAPADMVLREEFAKIVMLAMRFETLAGNVVFDDVDASDWFFDYVTQAYLCGVINGESENNFGSGKRILRQDMAVMCYNALVKKGIIDEGNEIALDYIDSAEISGYAQNAVGALTSLGIVSGNDDNTFKPNGLATRAEAAQMIYNVMKYIEKAE